MKEASKKIKVLFLCNHNAARSQMAEGILKSISDDRYHVESAGNNPSSLNPYAVKVMAEIGVDISKQRSKNIEEFEGITFEYVATVCGGVGETCPVFLGGKNYFQQPFEDPVSVEGTDNEKIMFFRSIRDEMKVWIEKTFIKG